MKISQKYGFNLSDNLPGVEIAYGDLTDLQLELLCYLLDRKPSQGGLGKHRHFLNAFKIAFPKLELNDWALALIEAYVNENILTFAGCASVGKSEIIGASVFLDWIADPNNTTVILTAPTIPSLKRNLWAIVRKHFKSQADEDGNSLFPGHIVESELMIQATMGDAKNALCAVAVRSGDVDDAASRIQGGHNARVRVVCDEMTNVQEGIMKAVANLQTGCADFKFVGIGNPNDKYDQHGQWCEPEEGWENSDLSEKDTSWRTKKGGLCLHFNAYQSPNVIAGKRKWKGLISKEDIEKIIHQFGEDSPEYWAYVLGWWAPEGLVPVIIPRKLAMNARNRLIFIDETERWSSVDPAFEGGDNCIQLIAEVGLIRKPNIYGFNIIEEIPIVRKVSSDKPVDYQLADAIMANCKKYGVSPEHLALDTTGRGKAVAGIILMQFGAKVLAVDFGGAPSEKKIRNTDPFLPAEKFDRRVTELYALARAFLEEGQVGGISENMLKELSARRYRLMKIESQKQAIETKKEYKERAGASPDRADGFVVLTELLRTRGIHPAAYGERHDHVDHKLRDSVRLQSKRLLSNRFTNVDFSVKKVLYTPRVNPRSR